MSVCVGQFVMVEHCDNVLRKRRVVPAQGALVTRATSGNCKVHSLSYRLRIILSQSCATSVLPWGLCFWIKIVRSFFFSYSMDLSERPKGIKVCKTEQKLRMSSQDTSTVKEPPQSSSDNRTVVANAPVRAEISDGQLSPSTSPAVSTRRDQASQKPQASSIRNYFLPCAKKRCVFCHVTPVSRSNSRVCRTTAESCGPQVTQWVSLFPGHSCCPNCVLRGAAPHPLLPCPCPW